MHIVFITMDFVENNGPTTGLPKYLLRVSKALVALRHKVSVITCSNRTVSYDYFGVHVYRVRRPAIKLYGVPERDVKASYLRDGYILNTKLNELFQKEKIDIVQYTSLEGLAYFHQLPIPSVMRLSSYSKMLTIDNWEKERDVRVFLEQESAKNCDGIFGPSKIVAEEFGKDVGQKVKVIESPFVMDEQQEDISLYQEQFYGKQYLLFYGTLIKFKGLNVIADCIYDLLNNYPSLYIGIIGDGDLKLVDLIRKNAKENAKRVIYHSAVGFSLLKPIIKNAEAIMLPSLMENLSNACIECLALGQIVIGTRGASFDQLIDDEVSGFLCEIGDNVSLNQAIDKVMDLSDEKRQEIQEKARKRTALLSPDIVVKQLVEYYEQVIRDFQKKQK